MRTRCLFRCGSVKTFDQSNNGVREYEFYAQYDQSIPEERRFATATPSGNLRIMVNNPDVEFEVGKSYYIDIEAK